MSAVALSDIVRDRGLVGGPFGSSLGGKDYVPNGVPVIRGINLGLGRTVGGEFVYVSEQKFSSELWRNDAKPGDLVLTQRGTLGQVAIVPDEPFSRYVISQSQMRLRVDPARAVANYVYYACSSAGFNRQIRDRAIATGVPHINLGILSKLTIPLPSLAQQRGIAEVLGALDDKIAANTKTLSTIGSYLAAEFDAASAVDGVIEAVSEIATFHNRRRVPLSAMERAARQGVVPYYGATGQFGWVDEPIFDDHLVLVGEDGSVITDDGNPVVQYIWGPAWVNNHAHVLTGNGLSTELLFLALQRTDIRPLVTGAVQPKVSMGNLKRLEVRLPAQQKRPRLDAVAMCLMALHRNLTDESRTLASTRDALLPALMSGRLRVKDAEAVAESAL